MQENPQILPHTLLQVLYLLAIALAGGLGALIDRFINRKKITPEVAILEASAIKIRAEARKLDGETIDLAWDRIDDLTAINSELTKKLDLCEIRSRHHETQEKRMLALMELHGIKYKEYDDPKNNMKYSEMDEPK